MLKIFCFCEVRVSKFQQAKQARLNGERMPEKARKKKLCTLHIIELNSDRYDLRSHPENCRKKKPLGSHSLHGSLSSFSTQCRHLPHSLRRVAGLAL